MDTNLCSEEATPIHLFWRPFIGKNYTSLPQSERLLIIGESHFYNPAEGEQSLKKHQDRDYTRRSIEGTAIEREYRTNGNGAGKIFQNLHFTLFGNDRFDTSLLWDHVAFYNFIQEPMNTNKGRPKKENFKKGWVAFTEAVDMIKPSTCLFLGTTSIKYLPRSFTGKIQMIKPISDDGWLNRTASKKMTLQLQCGHQVLVKFIRHPSNRYSWSEWNQHLEAKYPQLMQCFSRSFK
jgi:hypothetical protein